MRKVSAAFNHTAVKTYLSFSFSIISWALCLLEDPVMDPSVFTESSKLFSR